ncbi:MAG: LysR family transcriptional regulator, partial [Bdellovibrionales bacterium]|nr:LysR family transcriptional regulator [Bdellovibrionales bacterium]
MSLPSLGLDAFFACSQTSSFSLAAEQLHITQSALSQRVAKLEAELGTSLFIRDPSGLKLTPAGQELLRYCLAKNSLEKESLARINGGESQELSGVVRIGGFSSIMRSIVLPSLSKLLNENSNVKLTFVTKEIDELPQLLRTGEIDYMIHYNTFHKDEIETLNLGEEENVLVEKKNYKGPNIFLDHDERDEATARYLKMTKNNKINYIEIPAKNIEATKAFFSEVFDWSFVDYGPDYCS